MSIEVRVSTLTVLLFDRKDLYKKRRLSASCIVDRELFFESEFCVLSLSLTLCYSFICCVVFKLSIKPSLVHLLHGCVYYASAHVLFSFYMVSKRES